MKNRIAVVTVLCVLCAAPCASSAQAWPQRPVKVIVPFAAGGNTDSQARILSEALRVAVGQPFLVENRAGASGAIAVEFVVKAPADGYTLLFAASPQISTVPLLQKVSYDPFKDLAPVSMVSTNPFVLGVNAAAVPVKSVQEFVEFLKARPGRLNYGSAGTGSLLHLSAEILFARAGVRMAHVPYKGSGPAVADLIGGQVQMVLGNPADFIQQAKGGKIVLLGVSSARRAPALPDVPPIADTYPGFDIVTWNGFLAPGATPRAVVDQLAREVARVVREPLTAERLEGIGVDPVGNTPDEFAEFIRRDAPMWRQALAAAGIKQE